MDAKEQAVENCENCPIAKHVYDIFSIGYLTNSLHETQVASKVDEDGLYVGAETGYGDFDKPCWDWSNRPYFRGLKNAFHKELAAVLAEGLPIQELDYTPGNEYQVISQLLGCLTVNGKPLFISNGTDYNKVYTLMSNPSKVIYMDITNRRDGLTVYLHSGIASYFKTLTGRIPDDMFEILIALFDMIDA